MDWSVGTRGSSLPCRISRGVFELSARLLDRDPVDLLAFASLEMRHRRQRPTARAGPGSQDDIVDGQTRIHRILGTATLDGTNGRDETCTASVTVQVNATGNSRPVAQDDE